MIAIINNNEYNEQRWRDQEDIGCNNGDDHDYAQLYG